MDKVIAIVTVLAVSLSTLGAGVGLVQANGSISTGLTRVAGGGDGPIIKAKWEMLDEVTGDPGVGEAGNDDSTADGAQFNPPGQWGENLKYSVCAIVTDPDGVSDIDRVFTDIYYPANVAFNPAPGSNPDDPFGGQQQGVLNPTTPDGAGVTLATNSPDYDYGTNGCAAPVEDENELTQLSKADGIELFCNQIKNHNNNLPTFFKDPNGDPYDYDEICGATGELEKETAYVYCADKTLTWEDPAGDYKVTVMAQDKAGQFSFDTTPDENYFTYEPLTAFEVDFSSIDYGNVKLNTHKRISGDKDFNTSGFPTVRNTGNTRLYIGVAQDDMELGTTDGEWNVRYDARVGNGEQDWRYYFPQQDPQLLEDILDLSETEEMDFSIEVFKFPTPDLTWTGNMWLSAEPAPFRQCGL